MAYAIGLAFLTSGRDVPWFVRWVLERAGPQTAHSLGYALLAGCLCWALGTSNWKRILVVSMLAALLGALLEYGQLLVPGRSFSGQDMLANLAGSVAGSVLCAGWGGLADPR